MIYITGDTHAPIDLGKLSTKRFPIQKELSKQDYLIICGDCGLVWDDSLRDIYWQQWLSDKKFTTLWIDGNHENFDLLYQYPLIDRFGGKVREISTDIFHLDRGQVLNIDGKKFFVMGGATSHDKIYRKEHISWWQEEVPSLDEMNRGIEALDANNWTVDYVLTHCAPRGIQTMIEDWYENDELTSYLERIRTDLKFTKWFFGHYHIDKEINEKFTAVYNNIIPIK